MPVTPQQIQALDNRITSLESRVSALEALHDVNNPDSLEERLTHLESIIISEAALAALLTDYEGRFQTLTATGEQQQAVINDVKAAINILNRWRNDLRGEVVWEQATGSGTDWAVGSAYDSTSPFIVFQANLTLVNPATITFSDPSAGEFTSGVSLTPNVHVLYFKAIPEV